MQNETLPAGLQTPPFALPRTWDSVADGYEAELSPVFESYSKVALQMAGVRPGIHIVDIAAGPGTLVALVAKDGVKVTALDFSPAMIGRLQKRAAVDGWPDVTAVVGDGMALPFEDGSFDAAFSMFGLMFFKDRARGFSEMLRVLRPDSPAVISSWLPLSRVPLFFATMSILADLLPDVIPSKPLPPILNDRDLCRSEMTSAGFGQVDVVEHSVSMSLVSTDAFVDSTLRTNAIVVHAAGGAGSRWPGVEQQLRQGLLERFGPGPQTMTMTALITCGRKSAA